MKQFFLVFAAMLLSSTITFGQSSVRVVNNTDCTIEYTLEATDGSCMLSLGGGTHTFAPGQVYYLFDSNPATTGFKLELVNAPWPGNVPPVFTDDPNCGLSSVVSSMMLPSCTGVQEYVYLDVDFTPATIPPNPAVNFEIDIHY